MKKVAALLLTASLALSPVISAMADSRTIALNEGLADTSQIHILYNDALVKYEDVRPINTEGRVMIPFRAALENMGAKVDYTDSERLVTAEKDGITISFTLMDDTIYIDNNGEQSTMTMDVPMIIVEDRTLVPIRFMSEAFGMQVGWDQDSETVVIMDYDNYFEKFSKAAPNISYLAELNNSSLNKSNVTFEFSYDSGEGKKPLDVSGKVNSVKIGNTADTDAELNVSSEKISLKKAKLDIILSDMTFYIKTEALKQLAKSSDNAALKAAAALSGKNVWYSVDLAVLLADIGMSEDMINVFATALEMGDFDIATVLKNNMTTEGEAVFDEAMALATQLDIYEAIDKYITIEMKETGGYTVDIDISPEEFADIINASLGSMMDETSLEAIAAIMDYTVKASVDNSVDKQTAEITADLNNAGSSEIKLTLKGTYTSDEKAKAPEIPEDSTDITDIITALLK